MERETILRFTPAEDKALNSLRGAVARVAKAKDDRADALQACIDLDLPSGVIAEAAGLSRVHVWRLRTDAA